MDSAREFINILREVTAVETVPVFAARVTEITGESCTIMLGELELTDVRLKATVNGAGNYILAEPKKGSVVLVASLTGDMKELAVIRMDEVARFRYVQDGLEIEADSVSGKVSLKNKSVSLLEIFSQLKTVIEGLKVNTPAGPSVGLLPDTVSALVKFETQFKQLLK